MHSTVHSHHDSHWLIQMMLIIVARRLVSGQGPEPTMMLKAVTCDQPAVPHNPLPTAPANLMPREMLGTALGSTQSVTKNTGQKT